MSENTTPLAEPTSLTMHPASRPGAIASAIAR